MGKPEKKYLLMTASGQPAVQSDDKGCILKLFVAFGKECTVLKREDSGEYKPLSMLEMEATRAQ